MSFKLENWEYCCNPTQYGAPETWYSFLSGRVYNNPDFEDGTAVITSQVVEFNPEEAFAITKSGSRYELGTPSEKYTDWCKENGYNPFTSRV